MESKALESWSSYHVSCQRGTQGLLWSQNMNTAALTTQLLKQNPYSVSFYCPLQQVMYKQCWALCGASQQPGQDSFQNDLSSGACITRLGVCFAPPLYCLNSEDAGAGVSPISCLTPCHSLLEGDMLVLPKLQMPWPAGLAFPVKCPGLLFGPAGS